MILEDFFKENPNIGLAFSGGTDSAYLLYAAMAFLKKAGKETFQIKAYYVKSPFQPAFELEDAKRLAAELGAELQILEEDVLSHRQITDNPENRCYYCKKEIFRQILAAAETDGCKVVVDGTNASDDVLDRPGMQALAELGIRSPLRECGITKTQIRRLSKEAGLFTWEKPAYACLATRIPSGVEITREKLEITERAEAFLFAQGFQNFRIRMKENCARIQVVERQLPLILEKRELICRELGQYYQGVFLDLEVRDE